MPPIPVAVVGVGLVGSEFLSQLISLRTPSSFKLVAIASSKKLLYRPSGLVLSQSGWKSDLANSNTPLDIKHLVAELSKAKENDGTTILVDNTSDETVASLYPEILRSGLSIVTPNKKAFSGDLSLFSEIVLASQTSGAKYLNESTVGAGLPIISTLKEMVATGDQVLRIEGVFSGTMSYIFNEYSKSTQDAQEPSFSSIVAKAREHGYTEPHPGDDLNGADVARKLTILSRLVPSLTSALPSGYNSVQTQSLIPSQLENVETGDEFVKRLPEFDEVFDRMKEDARKEGNVLRYVGVVDVLKGEIRAGLEKYPVSHPFASSLGGSDNIITFHTKRYSPRPLIIQGAGAGAAVTAMGVLGDCLKLVRHIG